MFVHNAAISLALLLFHVVIQPYEKRCINVLDTFMYVRQMVLISLIRLYSLYAFQHSEVIHTTAFYIQLLLIFAPILTSLYVLSSAWHTPFESTLRAKTLSSTKHIKQYRQVPRSGSDPQISFGKCSMRRDSGGMEDMSNPPTAIGEALTQSVYTINQQINTEYIYETSGSFWDVPNSAAKQTSQYQHTTLTTAAQVMRMTSL